MGRFLLYVFVSLTLFVWMEDRERVLLFILLFSQVLQIDISTKLLPLVVVAAYTLSDDLSIHLSRITHMAHPLYTHGRCSANQLRECLKCDTCVRDLRWIEKEVDTKPVGTGDRFTLIRRFATAPQDCSLILLTRLLSALNYQSNLIRPRHSCHQLFVEEYW